MNADDGTHAASCGQGLGTTDSNRVGGCWDLQRQQFPGFELIPTWPGRWPRANR